MAVFGEFLDAAVRGAEAAEEAVVPGPPDRVGVLRELRRLVVVLGRYLDDALTGSQASGGSLRSWERLAAQQREGLRQAERNLGSVTSSGQRSGTVLPGDGRVRGLARAADALGAGRELLGTHAEITARGGYVHRSRWGGALATESVLLAVAVEVGNWSGIASSWAQWAAGMHQHDPLAREFLGSAQLWLSVAAKAAGAAGTRTETAVGLELLRAVPLRAMPERIPPQGGEEDAKLCHGIMVSAERLRQHAFTPAGREQSRPLSGPAWRRTAQACAITADLACQAMLALAGRTAPVPGLPGTAQEWRDAASALAGARDAWLALTRLWRAVTTDTQDVGSPATADAFDLMLRMGRLVCGDARWTPSRRGPDEPGAALLALDEASLPTALAAVHHAIDALELVAHADADGVRAAGQARRLYMPASILGGIDIGRHPYRAAPPDRVFALQAAYQAAADATSQAARAMDTLAAHPGTATRVLGLLRSAAPASITGPNLRMPPDVLTAALQAFNRPAWTPRPHADIDDQAIVKAYVEDGLTMLQCSYLFSTPQPKVAAILKANGVTPGRDRGRHANDSDREVAPQLPRRRAAGQLGPVGPQRVIQPPVAGTSHVGPGSAPAPRM